MDFSICTGNHNNSASISDTVRFLKCALQECGHTTRINQNPTLGAINILIECFTDEASLKSVLDALGHGARFVLVATEPIIGGSFNGGIDKSHVHYSNAPYWKLRFDAFCLVAEMADAIWVLAEDMVPAYRARFPRLPVHFLPHGWTVGFATVPQRPEHERDIDFYFSGALTEYRTRILSELARKHSVVVNDHGTAEYIRQDHLSRAKVCLSLRLSSANRIPSVSRMHFHLQNRSFLLGEAYALTGPLDPFVLTVTPEDLPAMAKAVLAIDNRRALAEQVHDRFRAALPMSHLLPPLIEELTERIQRTAAVNAPRAHAE